MELEVGKTYLVNCLRKGKFTIRVTKNRETWIDGIIVDGVASAIMDDNICGQNESITLRASFIRSAVEQAPGE